MTKTSVLLLASAALTGSAFADNPPDKDRAAILGMAGEFKVTFRFEETVALSPDYTLKKPYKEEAHELVILAKDEPRHIELQHLLVADGMVIKHWRQVWTFEDTRICEYQGDNSWRMRDLTPAEAKGTWSQLVTQVDDSPRYESWGRWDHTAGVSTWTSGNTWRPLPRRELARSKEYQVIAGVNRHTLTPAGWVHEQDNTKTAVQDGKPVKAIVRELGLNSYERVKPEEKFDFEPARAMWAKDSTFWNRVNDTWAEVQNGTPVIRIADPSKLGEMHKAVSKLKDTAPAQPGAWPIRETIFNYLAPTAPAPGN